jgi:hypothetical protein
MATDLQAVLSGIAAAVDELNAIDQTPPVSLAIKVCVGPIFKMSLMWPLFHMF